VSAGCTAILTTLLQNTDYKVNDGSYSIVAQPTDDSFFVELIGGGSPIPERPYTDLENSLELAGFHHLCFMVESVDEGLVELKKRGVKIVKEAFELPEISRRLAFFADPWGNLLELAEVLH
jgi:catechol 2,3-dioxygenase-like lactoylglutathione lyase family enzyme